MTSSTIKIGACSIGIDGFFQILSSTPALFVASTNTTVHIWEIRVERNNFAEQFKGFVIVFLDTISDVIRFGDFKYRLHIIGLSFSQ